MRTMLLLLMIFSAAIANGQPAPPRERSLPPSLQRELKLRQAKGARIVSFRDTVKAQTILSRSIRDSSARELDSTKVSDSAVVVIDSSVSLSRKQLLDSMLSELPEYEITPSGGRFRYPPEILVETSRRTVPFDTTIFSHIQPVSRELLPYFDALPLPLPIAPRETKRFVIDAGVGAPTAPLIGFKWMFVSTDKTSHTLFGNYLNRVGEIGALKSHIHLGVDVKTLFANSETAQATAPPALSGKIEAQNTKRLLVTQNDSGSHGVTVGNADLTFSVGDTKQLRLESAGLFNLFSEEISNSSELSGKAALSFIKEIDSTSSRFQFDASFHAAGSVSDSTNLVSLWRIDALYHHFNIAPFEWSIGAKISSGSDVSGSRASFLPTASLTFRPSDELSLGAEFAPKEQIMTLSALSKRNLFYAFSSFDKNDPRRVTTDNINAAAFASYFLSSDEYIRGEARFITRKNEVIFDKRIDSSTKRAIFDVSAAETRRLEAEVGAKLLFFHRDELAATLHFTSATAIETDKALPYEPILRAEASWAFHSISEKLVPRVEFVTISRKDRSLAFINAELHYPLTRFAEIKLRAENIFGSVGDFWDGYNEYPRSILVSIRAAF